MPTINLQLLKAHRAGTYRLSPARPLRSQSQALKFVNQRGFVYLWPIKGVDLPSLWTAVAGDRPVAEEHDDPGHVTWGWKDDALPKRLWYYAKVLRRKATLISLDLAPFFYALSENYGSLEEDHLLAYEQGHLTLASKNIYAALLAQGPLDSIALRKAARLASAKESEWNRALEDLQADFKVLPIGVAEAGAWRYAFIYDITARYYPRLPQQARRITETQARQKLLETYIQSVGAAPDRVVSRIFGWTVELSQRVITALLQTDRLRLADHPTEKGNWLTLVELCK